MNSLELVSAGAMMSKQKSNRSNRPILLVIQGQYYCLEMRKRTESLNNEMCATDFPFFIVYRCMAQSLLGCMLFVRILLLG